MRTFLKSLGMFGPYRFGAMTVQELLISRSLYSRAMNELDTKGDA
jgi:hypothetical protein